MVKLAIFASGSGSNAEAIFRYFKDSPEVEVALVLSNKADAGVLERARNFQVPTLTFNRKELYETGFVRDQLQEIDWIVLAGFLWLVPAALVEAFPGRIINIHPALLPKYGGKGMYGRHVHEAVLKAGEKESGITIHYVNERYDEGNIIFQARCPVDPSDTPESLAGKIRELEHRHYPAVIDRLLNNGSAG